VLPACDAVKEQVPVLAVMLTVLPEIEQAPEEVIVTASPEVADAVTVNELP
jgi:hypothetical protein